jgi:hypothetical protein
MGFTQAVPPSALAIETMHQDVGPEYDMVHRGIPMQVPRDHLFIAQHVSKIHVVRSRLVRLSIRLENAYIR